MFAAALLDSLLLVIAAAALMVAGVRLSTALACGASALARGLATVVLAGALAVLEALILGRLGLSGSPAALTLLAVATGLAAWRLCPNATPGGQLPAAPLALAGFGALAGALIALAAIQLHRPVLGQDAITYHLPEVVGWVQSGHTGRVLDVFYGLPVGNYPVTEEVLLAWVTGISHGFSAVLLTTIATVPLLLGAGWLALAELGVPAPVRALALAALALTPLIVQAWVQPGTDLQAMTWLACCGALCLAARRHPGLLAAAVVAAGLAVGTKTTVLSYSAVMLASALWFQRAQLRRHWRALGAAAALAVLTGLVWYLRNWVDHGSPLWPFSSFPGGDPRPPIIDYLSTSLLDSLHRTLLEHLHGYASAVSGGVVLILVAILAIAPGIALPGRRALLIAGVVVLLGTLEYAAGPVTGLGTHGLALVAVVGSTLRYLMPAFAAGTVALALAAADRNRLLAGAGLAALVGALVWDLSSDLPNHFFLAFDDWLWPGIGLGALAGLAVHRGLTRRHATPGRKPSLTVGFLPGVLTALVLAAGATHFSFRHAISTDYAEATSIFLLTQPGYADTNAPVATSKTGLAQLAGDRLQHPLSVIPRHASCATVATLRRRHWLVIAVPPPAATQTRIPADVSPYGSVVSCLVRAGVSPVDDDGQYAVYRPLQS